MGSTEQTSLDLGTPAEMRRGAAEARADDLRRWLAAVSGPEWLWFIKILSGNDTLANGAHQAGLYITREVLVDVFPSIAQSTELNPRLRFPVSIDSHGCDSSATAIWYNNRVVNPGQGTRNESRITGWGGRSSPLLDPDSTGSAVVFAFHVLPGRDTDGCRVWLCSSVEEETALEERVGPMEPGTSSLLSPAGERAAMTPVRDSPCVLEPHDIPREWLLEFPGAAHIVRMAVERRPAMRNQLPDKRLVERRKCEYMLFRSIEEAAVLPRVREGFAQVDEFVAYANSVTNRRKARSGASLGLQAGIVFDEEGLSYSYDQISEGNKRPDFLFPSAEAYHAAASSDGVRMLAAKTTCKDRWRQILNEADKLPVKYLLTLQEGVSLNQYAEMRQAQVVLVVPSSLQSAYPQEIRGDLMSLSDFIRETQQHCIP